MNCFVSMDSIALFWFRRDLRLDDNHGLYRALTSGKRVLLTYIFDLDDWFSQGFNDQRVAFVRHELEQIRQALSAFQSDVAVRVGHALEELYKLCEQYSVTDVYVNREYEPQKIKRDELIHNELKKRSINLFSYNDHLILKPDAVLKSDGTPYQVFTPYSRKWREIYNDLNPPEYPSEIHLSALWPMDAETQPTKGLENCPKLEESRIPPKKIKPAMLRTYGTTRNEVFNEEGTSGLGVHLRYGTVSPRIKFKGSAQYSEVFTTELIWREFFASILYHFPRVITESFRTEYDRIKWRNNEQEFQHWKDGTTGYAIVDAGMRQLNQTGQMHNRVRMIVASFLVKYLLIDWRWGEAYFAEKLMDYDLASNNGNWQWAAGTGVDAAPYFRVFNPISQQQKFDPKQAYIRKWVPDEMNGKIPEMVDLKFSRERCLEVYKQALNA